MPATPLLAAGAALLAAPVLTVAVFLGSGAADEPAAGEVCTLQLDGTPVAGRPDATVVQLSGEQVANARIVVAATRALGLPEQAAAVALMTARQESSLLVLANPNVPGSADHPHQGEGSDLDSLGLFQQRPSQGWGSVAQLMDPRYASGAFLRALAAAPGWQRLPAWQAAQSVQASTDGTVYAQWAPLSAALAAALWNPVASSNGLVCGVGTTFTGPGGTSPPEACSVIPDPTTGRGCLTPRTAALAAQLMAQGWRLSCWDEHAWNPGSDHPAGRACDVFPGSGGALPSPQEKARGDALAASLQASAEQTGLNYLIWYGQQWSVARADEGWRPYNGGGVYDPTSITGGHYDHIHISVF